MTTPEDVREIALALPGASEGKGRQIGFGVMVKGKHKGFAWEWMERPAPKKPREPNPEVYAVRVPNLVIKEALLQEGAATGKYFTEPHYDGYPAVLVRLALVELDELAELLEAAYACFVPRPG